MDKLIEVIVCVPLLVIAVMYLKDEITGSW